MAPKKPAADDAAENAIAPVITPTGPIDVAAPDEAAAGTGGVTAPAGPAGAPPASESGLADPATTEAAAPVAVAGVVTAEVSIAPADPAPAPALDEPSGAVIEPAVLDAVDVAHGSVDANPRAGTTADQNRIDFNDPERRDPTDPDFVGMGLDPTPYGKG